MPKKNYKLVTKQELAIALSNLVYLMTHGDKTGNPYMKKEVTNALHILSFITDTKNYSDANENFRKN